MADEATAESAVQRTHPGLILGIARFYYDPRGSMRGMLDSGPTEARLLAYAMISAMILLIGRLVQVESEQPGDLTAIILAQVVSMLFFVPLAYYGLAAVGTMICRTFGAKERWVAGRAAFFWAVLVSSPLMLLSTLGRLVTTQVSEWLSIAIAQIGPVFFAWALAACFAETFGFRHIWKVLGVVVAPILLILAVSALLKA